MLTRKKKKCLCCNEEKYIWGDGLCKLCFVSGKPGKSLRKSKKDKPEKKIKIENTKKLHEWFREQWDDREDDEGYCYCYETGVPLHRSLYRENSCCYSHILPKSKFPQYAMSAFNIVIVHPDQHAMFESNPKKTPRQKELYDQYKAEIS